MMRMSWISDAAGKDLTGFRRHRLPPSIRLHGEAWQTSTSPETCQVWGRARGERGWQRPDRSQEGLEAAGWRGMQEAGVVRCGGDLSGLGAGVLERERRERNAKSAKKTDIWKPDFRILQEFGSLSALNLELSLLPLLFPHLLRCHERARLGQVVDVVEGVGYGVTSYMLFSANFAIFRQFV